MLAITLLSLLFANISSAATVQPWMWTPAKAGLKVRGTCVGVGSSTSGRFTAFRCTVAKKPLFVKVKRSGAGTVCSSRVSLGAVSASCLKVAVAPPLVQGSASEAAEAMGLAINRRFNPSATYRWQVALPQCTGTGPFTCSINRPELTTTATVAWVNGSPVVTFSQFTCGDYLAGRPGC